MSKIWIILWKDLFLRRNHYFVTALEILLPVGIIILANITFIKNDFEIDNDPISFKEFKINECIVKQSHYGNILYEPSTPFIDFLMSKAGCYAGYKKSNVKYGILHNSSYFSIGVKFERVNYVNSSIPNFLNYTLYPTNKAWTNLLTLWRDSGKQIPKYSVPSLYDVIELQRAIDSSFLELKNVSALQVNMENTDFFGRDPRIFSISIYFAMFLAFSLMVPPNLSRVIQEKYTGAKELMLIMGVSRWQLWFSKFIDVFFFFVISVSGMVIFLYIPLKEDSNTLKISPLLVWSVIVYGSVGIICFLFFVSCFFNKAGLGVYCFEFFLAIIFIFNNVIIEIIELSQFFRNMLCLFPHLCLMNGISILLDFDFYGKQVRISEKLSGDPNSLTLLNVILMMTFNIFFYVALTWYLDEVKPGKFGVPKPYNFCFKKSYWVTGKVAVSCDQNCQNEIFPENFESVPGHLKVGLSLKNICKIYKSVGKGPVTAVENLSIDFYQGEISALLGHNGAGKTTVFSIITGMTYPSSGKVSVNGFDMTLNTTAARSSLGLCPQHDMLFNDLSTKQILLFYGVVKGLSLSESKKEAMDLIKKLKLLDVKNTLAQNLSGGQKRKVSLAIALIGGSKVLILDEPTSGLDPEIRREIWEILLGLRGTRTILLTTHFMEEADALCNRIAIMDHGSIKCYGTPMFLKSKYAKGYLLSVVVNNEKSFDISQWVKQFLPTAKLKSQNIRTMSFEIPDSEVQIFPTLFCALDEKQAANEIVSYSISLFSLEDVFLRLNSDSNLLKNLDKVDSPAYEKLEIEEELTTFKILGCLLYIKQFWALIFKKWIFFRKSIKSFLLFSILAAFLVFLINSLIHYKSQYYQSFDVIGSKQLKYSVDLYSPFLILFSNEKGKEISTKFENFVKKVGCDFQEVQNLKEAFFAIFKKDFYMYARKANLGVNFSNQEIEIFHNQNAVHMVPIALNLIHNFLFKLSDVNSEISTSINIQFANKDLFVFPQLTKNCRINDLPDFSGSQTMFYLLGPLQERIFGAKQIQLMITPTATYWFSNLLFDIVSFTVYMIVVSLGVGFIDSDILVEGHTGDIILSLLLWGIGLILVAYIITLFIKNIAAAFSVMLITYIVFSFIIYDVISLEGLPKYFKYLHPTCILKFGYSDLCAGLSSNFIRELFLYDSFLFAFLVLNDSKLVNQFIHQFLNWFLRVNYSLKFESEELVEQEEDIVKKLIKKDISDAALIVEDLKRWYFKNLRSSPAVRGISFVVNQGECFGLLGVNGAGKTSTFKMLTGSLPCSHGRTFISSTQLSFLKRQKCLFSIGYCPQSGGLIPNFSGRELLKFFSQLRGIPTSRGNKEVRKWLENFDLCELADQNCGKYSGGNQRKLSTAIALIGDCPLIFLDEPTSGVDPVSRRSIWNIIRDIQKEGQSIVLTSHSMDECEALCSRLAIMVKGKFRCIGETTTLKDKFGEGYCIQLKLSTEADAKQIISLKKSVIMSFEPGCELVEEHLTLLQYHLTNKSISWANLFIKLNILKTNFPILESFTASSTTLEQIFMHFARNQ